MFNPLIVSIIKIKPLRSRLFRPEHKSEHNSLKDFDVVSLASLYTNHQLTIANSVTDPWKMSTTTLPSPGRPTFGVEIEFLVAILSAHEADPDEGVAGLPPPLRIPFEQVTRYKDYVHDRVKMELDDFFGPVNSVKRSFIGNFDFTVQQPDTPEVDLSTPATPLTDLFARFREWTVTDDSSVRRVGPSAYQQVAVEVNAPVQFASPVGFKAISLGISLITSKFRCTVNVKCGLHVHVGCKEELLSLEQMRRLASLAHAAEPLLYTLHDPIRRFNNYSRPLQGFAPVSDTGGGQVMLENLEHVSNNYLNHLCHRYTGRDRRHGEEPLSAREQHFDETLIDKFASTREKGHFEPFTQEPRHTRLLPEVSSELDPAILAAQVTSPEPPPVQRARQRNIPHLLFQQITREERLALMAAVRRANLHTSGMPKQGPPATVFEAVRSIYAQPATCHISELMWYQFRPSVNITGHGCYEANFGRSRRTIEFRMGDGSLDAEWVATWAKICVGIFRFALNSSPCQFIDVLTRCDEAMKGKANYDIIDLLDDIGLFAEAEIAEKRLMANRYQWNLKFDEPEHELLFG